MTLSNNVIKGLSLLTTVAGIALAPFKLKTGISIAIAGLALFATSWMYNSCCRRANVKKLSEQYTAERDFNSTELENMGEDKKDR